MFDNDIYVVKMRNCNKTVALTRQQLVCVINRDFLGANLELDIYMGLIDPHYPAD